MSSSELRNENWTQDSKGILIDRIKDLVLRLSNVGPLKDRAISTIHSQVDRIEILVDGVERKRPSPTVPEVSREDEVWGQQTPTHTIQVRTSGVSPKAYEEQLPEAPEKASVRAVEVAQAAEILASRLSTVAVEFRERKDEFDRINNLLVNQGKSAAARIATLENHVAEMEDDFQSNESELRFLRIQLQSIQAQCVDCIHRHEDQELDESILNWKIDWEEINRRAGGRRKDFQVHLTHQLSDTSTVVDSI